MRPIATYEGVVCVCVCVCVCVSLVTFMSRAKTAEPVDIYLFILKTLKNINNTI